MQQLQNNGSEPLQKKHLISNRMYVRIGIWSCTASGKFLFKDKNHCHCFATCMSELSFTTYYFDFAENHYYSKRAQQIHNVPVDDQYLIILSAFDYLLTDFITIMLLFKFDRHVGSCKCMKQKPYGTIVTSMFVSLKNVINLN